MGNSNSRTACMEVGKIIDGIIQNSVSDNYISVKRLEKFKSRYKINNEKFTEICNHLNNSITSHIQFTKTNSEIYITLSLNFYHQLLNLFGDLFTDLWIDSYINVIICIISCSNVETGTRALLYFTEFCRSKYNTEKFGSLYYNLMSSFITLILQNTPFSNDHKKELNVHHGLIGLKLVLTVCKAQKIQISDFFSNQVFKDLIEICFKFFMIDRCGLKKYPNIKKFMSIDTAQIKERSKNKLKKSKRELKKSRTTELNENDISNDRLHSRKSIIEAFSLTYQFGEKETKTWNQTCKELSLSVLKKLMFTLSSNQCEYLHHIIYDLIKEHNIWRIPKVFQQIKNLLCHKTPISLQSKLPIGVITHLKKNNSENNNVILMLNLLCMYIKILNQDTISECSTMFYINIIELKLVILKNNKIDQWYSRFRHMVYKNIDLFTRLLSLDDTNRVIDHVFIPLLQKKLTLNIETDTKHFHEHLLDTLYLFLKYYKFENLMSTYNHKLADLMVKYLNSQFNAVKEKAYNILIFMLDTRQNLENLLKNISTQSNMNQLKYNCVSIDAGILKNYMEVINKTLNEALTQKCISKQFIRKIIVSLPILILESFDYSTIKLVVNSIQEKQKLFVEKNYYKQNAMAIVVILSEIYFIGMTCEIYEICNMALLSINSTQETKALFNNFFIFKNNDILMMNQCTNAFDVIDTENNLFFDNQFKIANQDEQCQDTTEEDARAELISLYSTLDSNRRRRRHTSTEDNYKKLSALSRAQTLKNNATNLSVNYENDDSKINALTNNQEQHLLYENYNMGFQKYETNFEMCKINFDYVNTLIRAYKNNLIVQKKLNKSKSQSYYDLPEFRFNPELSDIWSKAFFN